MRKLEYDEREEEIRILFPYDERLLGVVRMLPGRRWNREAKYWSVPRRHLEDALERLIPLGFAPSEELQQMAEGDPHLIGLLQGGEDDATGDLFAGLSDTPTATRSKVKRSRPTDRSRSSANGEPKSEEDPTLSISRLNERVRTILGGAFPEPFWIAGEIIGFDRNRHKKHVYFQLAEKEEGEDRPRASVTAVLFANSRERVEAMLEAAADPLRLEDGIRIRARVRVDVYPPTGSYQVIVEEIDPSFTLGEIAQRRERILAEIDRRGLREKNRERLFPVPPLRIALITSFESDAYNDFVNELIRSPFAFDVTVLDVHVQGANVEAHVGGALRWVEERAAEFDVAVIVRGGGARTDLMGFDSLPLACAVAELPIKVLVGIGHHRDQCVLDFVAHSEKTPTAAAQRLVASAAELQAFLDDAIVRLVRSSSRRIAADRERLTNTTALLRRSVELRLERARHRNEMRARVLATESARAPRREAERLADRRSRLLTNALTPLTRERERIGRVQAQILVAARRRLEREKERLEAREPRVRAADPARLLRRGYAWVRTLEGKTVKSTEQATPGDALEVRVVDGSFRVRVEKPDESDG